MPDVDFPSLVLEVVKDSGRFAQLAEPWERLAEPEPTPFCSHAWFSAWWDAFGGDGQLCVPVLWDGAEMAAAYPLFTNREGFRTMTNVHTPLFRPLARDQAALRKISATALCRTAQHLLVEPPPEADAALTELECAATESGARTLCSRRHLSPIVDTTGDFADWRAGSRPRWGAPLERFRRKMLRENRAEIRVVAEPEDLEAELQNGFAVEASGWKGRAGTAILSSPSTGSGSTAMSLVWLLHGESCALDHHTRR